MIQRIQTIWLMIAGALAFLTLRFSFYSGNKLVNNQKVFTSLTAASGNIFLLVLSVCVAAAALVLIFLYKDRKMQMKLTIAALLLSVANIALYYSETKKFIEGNYDITALFSIAIPIFLFFAVRGIYKDEKLIKSVDRLR